MQLQKIYRQREIINAGIIDSGFSLQRFDEHPTWTNKNVQGRGDNCGGKGNYSVKKFMNLCLSSPLIDVAKVEETRFYI